MLYPSDPAFPRVLQSSAVLIPFPTGQPKRASNASCTAAGSTVEPADAASASNLSNMLYRLPAASRGANRNRTAFRRPLYLHSALHLYSSRLVLSTTHSTL